MAQQTTMGVVVGYFERFIKKYPTIESVALAKEKDLLKLWQGLGYYARIRNFQKASQDIVTHQRGRVPQTYDELVKLKGVGSYTAAAIASICFNEQKAVVDGNVKRVIARLYNYKREISTTQANKYFENKAGILLSPKKPGLFNEAMMELGALVCQKKPNCVQCPVNKFCAAKDKSPEKLPVKNKTTYKNVIHDVVIMYAQDKMLFKKPAKDSLVSHLWELPQVELASSRKKAKIGQVKHAITNKRITTHVYDCPVTSPQLTKMVGNGFTVITRKELKKIPLNAMTQKCLDLFLS